MCINRKLIYTYKYYIYYVQIINFMKNRVMDAKLTLSFDEAVVARAKRFAEKNNISLSRLVEFLLQKTTTENYASLESLPIAEWVHLLSEGDAVYQTKKKTRKSAKAEYFSSKK